MRRFCFSANLSLPIMEDNKPRVLDATTPSVVAFKEGEEKLVGHAAKRQAVTNPTSTFYAVKRFIGLHYHDSATQKEPFYVEWLFADSVFQLQKKTRNLSLQGGDLVTDPLFINPSIIVPNLVF